MERFMEVQAEIMAGSYELYAEVLRRTIVKVAGELGWEIEPSRAQFLPDSVAYWLPFREANAAMDRLGKRYDDRDHLQHRRQAARASPAATCAPSSTSSSPPSRCAATSPTRPTSRSARGGSAARRAGSTSAPTTTNDVAPLLKMNVPVIWVNRHGEKLEGRKAPTRRGQELPRRGRKARRRAAEPAVEPLREVEVAGAVPAARRPGSKAERLIEGDRRLVALVGVELDPLAAAVARPLHAGLGQARPRPAPRASGSTKRSSSQASSAPVQTEGRKRSWATAAWRDRRRAGTRCRGRASRVSTTASIVASAGSASP